MSAPRFRIAVALLASGLIVAGAGGASTPASAASDAATVNGESISHDTFSDALTLLGAPEMVPGDPARQVLTMMIENAAIAQELESLGTDPSAAIEGAAGNVQDESTELRGLLVDAGLVDTESLRAEYEASGIAGGWLCAIALVPTEAELPDAVIEAQADGDDFETLAAMDGVEAQAISGDMASPCVQASGVPTELVDAITAAVEADGPGAASDPIEVQNLHLIVTAPEFDDVSGVLAASASTDAVADIMADADVSVDPRYGRWDDETLTVVPLGQA